MIAMLIVPAATALLLTDRLRLMLVLSALLAAVAAALGHLAAQVVPGWLGFKTTVSSGMMAVAAGGLFLLAWLLAPRHGILPKLLARRQSA